VRLTPRIAGCPAAATFRFRADIDGVFEMESHEGHAAVARLTVEP